VAAAAWQRRGGGSSLGAAAWQQHTGSSLVAAMAARQLGGSSGSGSSAIAGQQFWWPWQLGGGMGVAEAVQRQ
jgi:hypothetical protein